LPGFCIVCGQEASDFKVKTFSWHPPWVWVFLLLGLLPFVIIALVLTKRFAVSAPLCYRHQGHWTIRTALILAGLLILVAGVFVLATLNVHRDLATWFWLGWLGALIAWVITVIVLSVTAVRPTSITDREIILTGVAPEFVDALENQDRLRARADRQLRGYRLVPFTDAELGGEAAPEPQAMPSVERAHRGPPPRPASTQFQDKAKRSAPGADTFREHGYE
jgi:hypothetical protein